MCQVVAGFALLLGSIGFLGWNEFNFVRNLKLILKVEDETSASSCWPNARPDLDKKPIIAYCAVEDPGSAWSGAQGGRTVADWEQLVGPVQGLEFRIEPELYHYKEVKKCRTESECEYTYTLEWSSSVSTTAYHCGGAAEASLSTGECKNAPGDLGEGPRQLPRGLERVVTYSAQQFTLGATQGETSDGAFKVEKDSKLFERAKGYAALTPMPLEVTDATRAEVMKLFEDFNGRGQVSARKAEGRLYWSQSADGHQPGDVRVTFSTRFLAPKTGFTVVALKDGRSLKEWDTKLKGTASVVAWMESGPLDLAEMTAKQRDAEGAMVWVFRALGFVGVYGGLWCITAPLEQAPSLLPVVGGFLAGIVGWVLHVINLCVACMITLFVVGIAWTLARPMCGMAMLAGVLILSGAVFYLKRKFGKRKGPDGPESEPLLAEVEDGTADNPPQVPEASA